MFSTCHVSPYFVVILPIACASMMASKLNDKCAYVPPILNKQTDFLLAYWVYLNPSPSINYYWTNSFTLDYWEWWWSTISLMMLRNDDASILRHQILTTDWVWGYNITLGLSMVDEQFPSLRSSYRLLQWCALLIIQFPCRLLFDLIFNKG